MIRITFTVNIRHRSRFSTGLTGTSDSSTKLIYLLVYSKENQRNELKYWEESGHTDGDQGLEASRSLKLRNDLLHMLDKDVIKSEHAHRSIGPAELPLKQNIYLTLSSWGWQLEVISKRQPILITGPNSLLNRPEVGDAPSAGWLDVSSQARTSSPFLRKNFHLGSVRTQASGCPSSSLKH